jgi:hypothetical protein
MEIIKRKIYLEDYTSREEGNWGELTASAFTMNVFFTQDADDMGIATDIPFITKDGSSPTYQPLLDKLNASGYSFNFMNGATTNVIEDGSTPNTRYPNKNKNAYYINGIRVTGLTEDRLDVVQSYDKTFKYKPLFDIIKGNYLDFEGNPYQGGTRVIEDNNKNPITYIIDGDVNEVIDSANPNPQLGLFYKSYSGASQTKFQFLSPSLVNVGSSLYTELYFKSQGFNNTNTFLSAGTKEEYLFGITSTPRVESDLFIDRGRATIIQSHMQLGEVTNMSELINYGNGYYKIQKQ